MADTPKDNKDVSAFKRCLQAVCGIPVEAAITKFGSGLSPEQATYLRALTEDDLRNIRQTEKRLFEALGESGDGCGVYNLSFLIAGPRTALRCSGAGAASQKEKMSASATIEKAGTLPRRARKSPSYKAYLEAHARQGGALILEICHYCPVGCAHCHIASGPDSKLALDPETIRSAVQGFSSLPDAEYVFCTGGEPFSRPDLLGFALEQIHAAGLVAYTLTSGNWARSYEAARRYLQRLPSIDLFAVSFDQYHEQKIGLEAPALAVKAALDRFDHVFVCIGHLGKNDDFRSRALQALGTDVDRVDVIYYPLLARGSGSELPELSGRELSRSPSAPCFSVGAPIVVANGALVACCQSTQANAARSSRSTPLTIGNLGTAFTIVDGMSQMARDPFIRALRTVGPAEIARASGVRLSLLAQSDICSACEYLQRPEHHKDVLHSLKSGSISEQRMAALDQIYADGSGARMVAHFGGHTHE